ncbi:hypothetical protein TrispH2_004633 [Trichoplax sp. H2]|uniref:Proline-rich transmembrane protein 3/4 domain-containing protein n=1 Tax=Trichoplax adhaerens TaxID=10228 RepID=B3S017_TRIAD|nr:hypothetical protein TRIADDRAFT_57650 [Trichoplax adhaerens]EDV23930.1 hypothetical protein TRIADDRAFT_57650 [Trichoplax adhaerens]RDD44241.1 hypothetical protein TrispH2_004633 [Trichoplax sp. H2]|eukprot:XP_002113456.1 hypothetical protein TRIADDRAFT_57650 [Trichoplax adhaerens]
MACETETEVPEPNPHWVNSSLITAWSTAFQIHNYFFAACFLILTVYAGICLLTYGKVLFKKHFYFAINGMLLFLGIVRTCFLIIDPYESANALHRYGNETYMLPIGSRLLFGLGYPCLTSAFSLIFLAIFNCVRVKVVSPKIHRPVVIIAIVVIHFTIVLVADITTALCGNAKMLLVVCQSFFIIWGVILCTAYLVCGYRILAFTSRNSKTLVTLSASSTYFNIQEQSLQKKSISGKVSKAIITSTSFPKSIPKTVHKTLRITILTALLGLICVILNCYSLFGIYGVLAPPHFPDPWLWLIYQTMFRFFELSMAVVMAYTTNGSKKKRPKSSRSSFKTAADGLSASKA